nr:hypothetical protein [Tanacetum cinerariifolium]
QVGDDSYSDSFFPSSSTTYNTTTYLPFTNMATSTNLTTTKVSFNLYEKIQVAQKKIKIAFENADSSSRVELIPSKIKLCLEAFLAHPKIHITSDLLVLAEILKKFELSEGKSASTPIDADKPLLKDSDVCACVRFQVTPKVSHLNAVKRIFRYLKGKPYLGLWYLKDSPFDLVAYSDSDYAGASLDKKSTTGGCQFFGCRLIYWQCKKQTVVATSSTEAEYIYLLKLLMLEDFNTWLQVLDF